MNKKVWAVIKREFVTRAKTKGFIIGTLLFPVLVIFIFSAVFLFSLIFKPSTRQYYIVDQSNQIYNEFVSMNADTFKNGQPKYRFTEQKVDSTELERALESYQEMVRNKQLDGYLFIPADVVESRQVKYSARNISDWDELRDFERALSRIVTNIRLEQKGFSANEIRKEMSQGYIHLVSRQVTQEGEVEKSGLSSFGLAYLLGYMMLLMIMIYGQMLLRSVIEEKTQRITETIISSIRPVDLMLGKIIGICALGLTQLVMAGLFIYLAVAFAEPIFTKFGVTDVGFLNFIRQIDFSSTVFAFLIIFFLLGFVFYSCLYAALGAMVTTEDEGQQMQMPIIFAILAAFFMMIPIIKNPETPMAFWTSLIPFFTPITMFGRVAVSDPMLPSGAILSVFTMIIFTGLLIWVVAKIYRVGILMYGKKASLKEALKWVRYK